MRSSRPLFTFRPTFRLTTATHLPQSCLLRKTFNLTPFAQPTHTSANFSSSAKLLARKGKGDKGDPRITSIRYHLSHALTPRPLRLSRLRALRHWTIHRAWQLHLSRQRTGAKLALEKQYASMRAACEALRLVDEDGMTVPGGSGLSVGEEGYGGGVGVSDRVTGAGPLGPNDPLRKHKRGSY